VTGHKDKRRINSVCGYVGTCACMCVCVCDRVSAGTYGVSLRRVRGAVHDDQLLQVILDGALVGPPRGAQVPQRGPQARLAEHVLGVHVHLSGGDKGHRRLGVNTGLWQNVLYVVILVHTRDRCAKLEPGCFQTFIL